MFSQQRLFDALEEGWEYSVDLHEETLTVGHFHGPVQVIGHVSPSDEWLCAAGCVEANSLSAGLARMVEPLSEIGVQRNIAEFQQRSLLMDPEDAAVFAGIDAGVTVSDDSISGAVWTSGGGTVEPGTWELAAGGRLNVTFNEPGSVDSVTVDGIRH